MTMKSVRQQTHPSTTGRRTVQSHAWEIFNQKGEVATENNASLVNVDTTPGLVMFWSGRDNFAGVQHATFT